MATSVTTNFVFGQKDVATAGTEVQLDATSRRLRALTIIAHSDNVGRIFYGGSDVASTTQKGLAPGESLTLSVEPAGPADAFMDLQEIWIDSANNNDGVDFIGALA